MSSNVFSLEKFYRTQPPQQIGALKVSGVLEYLAFSGSSVYPTLEAGSKTFRCDESAIVVDVHNNEFLLESRELATKAKPGQDVSLAFGYKRKRAYLKAKIVKIDQSAITLLKPNEIILTNLRRNPRLLVDVNLINRGLKVSLQAETGVGSVSTSRAQVYEISQLGICLFVDRSEALVLPGDKITSLEIEVDGGVALKTSGVVSRVDMKKRSATAPNSYEVICLFRDKQSISSPLSRSAKRTPILDEKPCYFTAEHPFFPGRKLQGQVFEVSTSGLSCILEKTSFPVLPGMRFKNCSLQLPHKPCRDFVFEVAHVDFRSDGFENHFRLGGEFLKAPVELIKDITSYAQEAEGNLVQDVSEDDLDLLWEFMFETNFVYQDKRRLLQGQSKEILNTYHRLISTDNPIVKKITFKEEQEIKGHISAIHFYDRAWIIQHLNALKSSTQSAAQSVIQGIVNFFKDAPAMNKTNIFYVMSFYRPNNLYPTILFGESCRRINDPLKSCTIDLAYGLYQKADESRPSKTEDIRIDQDRDLLSLSDHLIGLNMISFVRACGLSQPSELKIKIAEEFERLGLFRERHLLAMQEAGEWVWAVVETASVGLNLSELTNSISIFTRGENPEVLSRLSSALIDHAYELYFKERSITPAIMQFLDSPKAFNVNWSKTYTCWITAASAVAEFETHSRHVIEEFKELIEKYKGTEAKAEVQRADSA